MRLDRLDPFVNAMFIFFSLVLSFKSAWNTKWEVTRIYLLCYPLYDSLSFMDYSQIYLFFITWGLFVLVLIL